MCLQASPRACRHCLQAVGLGRLGCPGLGLDGVSGGRKQGAVRHGRLRARVVPHGGCRCLVPRDLGVAVRPAGIFL